jgi:hypothetical protein
MAANSKKPIAGMLPQKDLKLPHFALFGSTGNLVKSHQFA